MENSKESAQGAKLLDASQVDHAAYLVQALSAGQAKGHASNMEMLQTGQCCSGVKERALFDPNVILSLSLFCLAYNTCWLMQPCYEGGIYLAACVYDLGIGMLQHQSEGNSPPAGHACCGHPKFDRGGPGFSQYKLRIAYRMWQ